MVINRLDQVLSWKLNCRSASDVVSLTGRMRNAMIRRLLGTGLAAICLGGGMQGWSSTPKQLRVDAVHASLAHAEQSLRRIPLHISEFTPMSEPLAMPRCGDVRPPEALATPDPLRLLDQEDRRVRVSFIVGADGRVHSAFILDSGGPRDDQVVLRAVRRWRYRPALCNGVPTDSEARVQFEIH
jgi:TonB family protein